MNTKEISCFECSNCWTVYKTREYADKCCLCTYCGKIKHYDLPVRVCKECSDKRDKKLFLSKERKPMAFPLMCDLHDRYFWDSDDLLDWLTWEISELKGEDTLTLRLLIAKKIEPKEFNASHYLEDCADPDEGVTVEEKDIDEINEIVNTWLTKHADESWTASKYAVDENELQAFLVQELSPEEAAKIYLEALDKEETTS